MSARIDALLEYPTLITYGLRWWAKDGSFIGDISDKLVVDGSRVSRSSRDPVNATFVGRLRWVNDEGYPLDNDELTRTLLQPFARLIHPTTGEVYEWGLGLYLAEAPRQVIAAPANVEIQGYDVIAAYNTPITYSYAVATGTPLADAAAGILAAPELLTTLQVDYLEGALPVAAAARDHLWSLTEEQTYLEILNDIMAMGGYENVYTDRQGYVRSNQITRLYERSSLLTLRTDARPERIGNEIHMPVSLDTYVDRDQWNAPNYWLGVSDNPENNIAPTEGAGIYELEFAHGGPTSVLERGRRVNSVVTLDAVDQNSLIHAVERQAELDTALTTEVKVFIPPYPEFWHEDVVNLDLPEIGLSGDKMYVTAWELPLNGGMMSLTCHRLREVASGSGSSNAIGVPPKTTGPPVKPSKPAGLALTGIVRGFEASWSASTGTAPIDYELAYRKGNADWTSLPSSRATAVSVDSLDPGATYQVRVRAKNSVGNSDWSDVGQVLTLAPPPKSVKPGVPTGLALVARIGGFDASWTAPTLGTAPISYDLRYRTGTDSWSVVQDLTTDVYDASGLTEGTAYEVQVRASNIAGESPWTTSKSVTTLSTPPPAPPDPPTQLQLTAGVESITASWTAPAAGSAVTHYDLRYRAGSAPWSQLNDISTTSRTITGLTGGTTYEVQVRSGGADGDSAWTTSASVAAKSKPKPSKVAIDLVFAVADSGVFVAWFSAGDDVLTYTVSHKAASDADWTAVSVAADPNNLDYVIEGYSSGVRVSVRVRASNTAGDGPWSDISMVTTT